MFGIINFFNKTIGKILGIITLLIGIFGFGYFKGKSIEKTKQEKKELEKTKEVLKETKKIVEKQQDAIDNVNIIKKEEKEKIKEEKKKDSYNLGKWVIFAFIFLSISCTKTEYITTPCPKPLILPRPELNNATIYRGMVLDNKTYDAIIENDIKLKSLIKQYEIMIKTLSQ